MSTLMGTVFNGKLMAVISVSEHHQETHPVIVVFAMHGRQHLYLILVVLAASREAATRPYDPNSQSYCVMAWWMHDVT